MAPPEQMEQLYLTGVSHLLSLDYFTTVNVIVTYLIVWSCNMENAVICLLVSDKMTEDAEDFIL